LDFVASEGGRSVRSGASKCFFLLMTLASNSLSSEKIVSLVESEQEGGTRLRLFQGRATLTIHRNQVSYILFSKN